ncbi:hypothetical protein OWM54_23140 [Myxococcus sp. MISCRS1]|jgi:hypothetical protein|uniref:hypothetical protein n=1 Tax=Myxococcus TaxID=32 RepID=UPI001CBAAF61|nr:MULTISPECIES: hypothetical protein [unclassified Myxococcus]MBZ4412728.1 hypothetical protein [Myxococcus sp. XM-1-1-1]MCY1000036.1 hypothetical protein [Myxococcus sp. MISCRS1]
MSPASANPGCQVRLGFLLPHECGAPASIPCELCGKLACELHLTSQEDQTVCTGCAGVLSGESDEASTYYDDYGYYGRGASWGGGSSRDPHDFTEADGESLRHEEDASFEEDLGGS